MKPGRWEKERGPEKGWSIWGPYLESQVSPELGVRGVSCAKARWRWRMVVRPTRAVVRCIGV